MDMEEMQFAATIQNGLAAHPEWFRTAIASLTAGMANALDEANQRAAEADMAWRCALTLVHPDRVTKETKDHIGMMLVKHLKKTGATCEIESKVLKQLKPSK
jgi:hypothetical protein